MIFGSGFAENITKKTVFYRKKILWNDIKTLAFINNPKKLFNLLEKKNIDVPKWSIDQPSNDEVWLEKNISSVGGYMVKFHNKSYYPIIPLNGKYFQKFIKGEIISAQFFCEKKSRNLLSICKQSNLKIKSKQFIIESIFTRKTDDKLIKNLSQLVSRVSKILDLKGLNSIDIIIPKENKNLLKIIEINPRPSLSINILSRIYKNKLLHDNIKFKKPKKVFATKILYSSKKIKINNIIFKRILKLANSLNYSELPVKNEIIDKNMPICLIHSESKDEIEMQKNLSYLTNNFNKVLQTSGDDL